MQLPEVVVLFSRRKSTIVEEQEALPGRATRMRIASRHAVLGTPMEDAPAGGHAEIVVGMGCFWGAERIFWQTPGVVTTEVGYAGGYTPNPTYEEVCSGMTGHTEAVRVVYDPQRVSTTELLRIFWESHDPTQGMRQGNDTGSQYRSAIYWTTDEQRQATEATGAAYQDALGQAGHGTITTQVARLADFYPAEDYHQQYLAKVPNGYCGIRGTGARLGDLSVGASCAVGVGVQVPSSGAVAQQ